MHKQVPILMAIGLLVLAGCSRSQAGLVTNPENVIGIWSYTSGAHVARFDADGVFHDAPSLYLVRNPQIRPGGEYAFEDGQLVITTPEDDNICGAVTAVYEVRLLENGNISITAIDDSCDERRRWYPEGAEYERVE